MKKLIFITLLTSWNIIFAYTTKLTTNSVYAYIISKNKITTCQINTHTGDLYNCNNKNGNYPNIKSIQINQVIQNGLEHKITNYFAYIITKNQSLSCVINPYTGMISYLNCHPTSKLDGINIGSDTFNQYSYRITSDGSISICTNRSNKCNTNNDFKNIKSILLVSIKNPIGS